MRKKLLAALLVGSMIITAYPHTAFADDTEIEKTKAQIAQKAEEIKKSNGEISVLDNRLIELQIKTEENKAQAEKINNQINDTKKDLELKEKEYSLKQEGYSDRLRVIYKSGNIAMIQTILNSKSFSDFLLRVKVVHSVIKEDTSMLKAINKVKGELTAKKTELSNKKDELEKVAQELDQMSSETQAKKQEQSQLVARLTEEKNSLNDILAGQEDALLNEVRNVLTDKASTTEQLEQAKTVLAAVEEKVTVASVDRNAADLNKKLNDQIDAIKKAEEAKAAEAARVAAEEEKVAAEAKAAEEARAAEAAREAQAATQPSTESAPAESSSSSDSSSSSESAPAVSSNSSIGEAAYAAARQYLGVPYVYGGSSYSGMDCSGLTSTAYREAGVSIPRTATAQYYACTKISRDQLQVGDLVFWGYGGEITHVTMYAGGGMTIHAPTEGEVVKIVPMLNMDYIGAGRPY